MLALCRLISVKKARGNTKPVLKFSAIMSDSDITPGNSLVFPENKISRESEKACSVIWKRKAQLCFCLSQQSNESQLRKDSTPIFRQKQRRSNLCRSCTCSAVDTADWEALVHPSKTKSKHPGSPSPPGVSLKYLRSTDLPGGPSISSKDEGNWSTRHVTLAALFASCILFRKAWIPCWDPTSLGYFLTGRESLCIFQENMVLIGLLVVPLSGSIFSKCQKNRMLGFKESYNRTKHDPDTREQKTVYPQQPSPHIAHYVLCSRWIKTLWEIIWW